MSVFASGSVNEFVRPKGPRKQGQPLPPVVRVPIAKELADFFTEVHGGVYSDLAMVPIGKLLWDLATQSAVCNIIRPTKECHGVLSELLSLGEHGRHSPGVAGVENGGHPLDPDAMIDDLTGGEARGGVGGQGSPAQVPQSASQSTSNWKNSYTSAKKEQLCSFRGQSLLAEVLDVYVKVGAPDLPQSFWPFVRYLMDNCMRAYPDEPILSKWKHLARNTDCKNELEMKDYQTNGLIYPCRPQQRCRGSCAHDTSTEKEAANDCTHVFVGHRKKTGGLMASFCPHAVCQGCHVIVNAEGRKDAFRFLFTRLEEAPQVVIYVCPFSPVCVSSMV